MPQLKLLWFDDIVMRLVMSETEPWWVVNDVCRAIGLADARDEAERLDSDVVRQADVIDSLGRTQTTHLVCEAGVYALIFRTHNPTETFRQWLTESVEGLRQYGFTPLQALPPVQMALAQAQFFVEQEARLAAAQQQAIQDELLIGALQGNGKMTILAYVTLNDLPDGVEYLNRLGRLAGQVARAEGVPAEKAHSTIFGAVNTWPVEIWDEALRQLDSNG